LLDPGTEPTGPTHSELDRFRRDYAAAYEKSLNDGSPLSVIGELSAEQQMVTKRLEDIAHRGERSLRRDVRVIPKGCRLKRHFTGCLRQIVGMAEKQAAHDPDRFTWNRQWKQAKKGRDGSKGDYGRTQKFRCQQMLEAYGIFKLARRFRNGAWRIGWDVADHSKITEAVDGWCHLNVRRCVISPRMRGEGLEEYLTRTIEEMVAKGIKDEAEGITEGIAEGIEKFPEGISGLCNPFSENEMAGGENRTDGAIPVAQLAQLNRTQLYPNAKAEPPVVRRIITASPELNVNGYPNYTTEPEEISENFKPDSSNKRYAKKHGLNLKDEVEAFVDLHGSHGNTRQNWQAVFRKHLINAAPLRGHVVDLPDWLPLTPWKDYLAMRERIGKGATKRAEELLIGTLSSLREQGYTVGAVLDRCTAKNWVDVRRASLGMTTGSLSANVRAQIQGTPTFDAVAAFRAQK